MNSHTVYIHIPTTHIFPTYLQPIPFPTMSILHSSLINYQSSSLQFTCTCSQNELTLTSYYNIIFISFKQLSLTFFTKYVFNIVEGSERDFVE